MTFAEFMRHVLYCPIYGYYEQSKDRIGREGDFYTNVNIGPLFGELLAFQFAEWLREIGGNAFQLIEAGTHDGQLAADILNWFRQKRPKLFASLTYWIVEPSPRRRAWQKEKLEHFAEQVRWSDSIDGLAEGLVNGIIFSNELLDAMPIHRFGWDAADAHWFEWGVTLKRKNPSTSSGSQEPEEMISFEWTRLDQAADDFAPALKESGFEFPPELLAVLPHGFTIEICPEAAQWWRQAATALKTGKLLTIDYGVEAGQLIAPERSGGTLRAYSRHHATGDVLSNVGDQDLTAHVNFAQLQHIGEAAGLRTEGLFSQERFFTSVAAKTWQTESNFGEWTSARLKQFRTLMHPEHLGRAFRVLLQSR